MGEGALRQALQGYDTGQGLTDAPGFQALLPQDTQMNFSLLLYQDFASLFAPFVENVLGGAERLNPDQRARLQELAPESTASMLYAYGEPERILFQTSGLRSGFGTGFGSLASLSFTAVLLEVLPLRMIFRA